MLSRHSFLHSRRAQIGTVEIFYQVLGRGEPLVLLHGLSGSGRWWSRNVEALARHFCVYIVDLVGFGASRNTQPFVLRDAAGSIAQWNSARSRATHPNRLSARLTPPYCQRKRVALGLHWSKGLSILKGLAKNNFPLTPGLVAGHVEPEPRAQSRSGSAAHRQQTFVSCRTSQ